MAHVQRQLDREREQSQRELWVWRILLLMAELSTVAFILYISAHVEELTQSGMLDTLYIFVGADISVSVVLLAILLKRQHTLNK